MIQANVIKGGYFMMTYEEELTELLNRGRFFNSLRIKRVTVPGMFFKDNQDFTKELIPNFGEDVHYDNYLYLVNYKNSYYVVGFDSKCNKSLDVWNKMLGPEWQYHKINNQLKFLSYKMTIELSRVKNPFDDARLLPVNEIDKLPELNLSKTSYYTNPMSGTISSIPKRWQYNQSFNLDGQWLLRNWDVESWPYFSENYHLFANRVELYVCGPWTFKCDGKDN